LDLPVTNLSPAAQAVLDALNETSWDWASMEPASPQTIAAATLRAAADQVVPEYQTTPGGSKIWPSEPVLSIRAEILAIADELEAQ
jgi:hypothetical protein